MTTTKLSPRIDAIGLPVPDERLLVDRDLTEGLMWWFLVDSLSQLRGTGRFRAASPLRNVVIHICKDADDVENARAALCEVVDPERADDLIAESKTKLESPPAGGRAVAMCTFSYDALEALPPEGD